MWRGNEWCPDIAIYIHCLEGSWQVSSISDQLIATGHHQSYIFRSAEVNGLHHKYEVPVTWDTHLYAQLPLSIYHRWQSGRDTPDIASRFHCLSIRKHSLFMQFNFMIQNTCIEKNRGAQFTKFQIKNWLILVTKVYIIGFGWIHAIYRPAKTNFQKNIPDCSNIPRLDSQKNETFGPTYFKLTYSADCC